MPINPNDPNKTLSVHEIAEKAERDFNLPVGILRSLGIEESHGLNQWDEKGNLIKSPTGPTGALQFTKATARQYNGNRDNPVDNILMGAQYMRDNYEALKNDLDDDDERWLAAAVAHNRGLGAVKGMVQNRRFMPTGIDSGNGGDTAKYAANIANNWANFREQAKKQGVPLAGANPESYASPQSQIPEITASFGKELPDVFPTAEPTIPGVPQTLKSLAGGIEPPKMPDLISPGGESVETDQTLPANPLPLPNAPAGQSPSSAPPVPPQQAQMPLQQQLAISNNQPVQNQLPDQPIQQQQQQQPREMVKANTTGEVLAGAAATVNVDLRRKPAGENAGRFLLRTALEQIAPQYGLSNEDIEGYLNLSYRRFGRYSKTYNNVSDEQLAEYARTGTNLQIPFTVTNGAINDILQMRSGTLQKNAEADRLQQSVSELTGGNFKKSEQTINPELWGKIKLDELMTPEGLEKEERNRFILLDEARNEALTKAEFEESAFNPGIAGSVERTLLKLWDDKFSPLRSPLSPFGAFGQAYDHYTQAQKTDDDKLREADESFRNIKKTYGSYTEYQKARQYAEKMSPEEYAVRIVAGGARSLVNGLTSSMLKGADVIDTVLEKINPLTTFIDQGEKLTGAQLPGRDYIPNSLHGVSNVIGYSLASMLGKGKEFEAATKDTAVDKKLFYGIGKRIEDYLGHDEYLQDTFAYKFSEGLGSAGSFLILGLIAPQLQIGKLSATSGVAGAMMEASSAYDEAKRATGDESKALLAGAYGIPLGATEMFGVGSTLARALEKEGSKYLFRTAFREFVKEKGLTFLREGGEEFVQEFFQSAGGKAVLEHLKDKDPSAFQRIKNTLNRLPKIAAKTATNEAPVAFLTGGVFGVGVDSAVSYAQEQFETGESHPQIDLKNNHLIVDGQRFAYSEKSERLVESWLNQRKGLDKVEADIQELEAKAAQAKLPEEKARIVREIGKLEKEQKTLEARERRIMSGIQQDLVPVSSTKAEIAEHTQNGLTSLNLEPNGSGVDHDRIETELADLQAKDAKVNPGEQVFAKNIGVVEIASDQKGAPMGTYRVHVVEGKNAGSIVEVAETDLTLPESKAKAQGIDFGSNASNRKSNNTELDAYNKKIRETPKGISLVENRIDNPNDNIVYHPDRAYRTIGKDGYADFLENGVIRAKQDSKQGYENPYFNEGVTSIKYKGKEYIAEAIPDSSWKRNGKNYSSTPDAGGNYLQATGNLTKDSKIRIYEKQADGSYEIVFDNIEKSPTEKTGKQRVKTAKNEAKAKLAAFGASEGDTAILNIPDREGAFQSGQISISNKGEIVFNNRVLDDTEIGRLKISKKAPSNQQQSGASIVGGNFQTLNTAAEIKKPTGGNLSNSQIRDYAPEDKSKNQTLYTERDTEIEVTPMVISDDDILTSFDEGFPQELQPRDRTRIASELQIEDIAAKLNPKRLADNPDAGQGRPILVPVEVDGKTKYAALTANGRITSIRRTYDRQTEKAEEYRRFVVSKDDAARNINRPVYAAVLNDASKHNLTEFVEEANEGTAQLSAVEQAVSDSKKIGFSMLKSLEIGEAGEINTPSNAKFARDFFETLVSPNQRGRFITEDGDLSQDGVSRIRNAVFASAFADSPAGLNALAKIAEDPDPNVRNIANGFVRAAGTIAVFKQLALEGNRAQSLDITKELVNALEKYSFLREKRVPVDVFVNQRALPGQAELSVLEKSVLLTFDAFKRSSKGIAQILDNYYAGAEEVGNPNQASMFGEAETPDALSLWQAAVEIYEEGSYAQIKQQSALFDGDVRTESAESPGSENEGSDSKEGEEKQPELAGNQEVISDEVVPSAVPPSAEEKTKKEEKENEKPPREFSSTQVNVPAEQAIQIVEFAKRLIPQSELAEDGFEEDQHITAKFGTETNDVEDIKKLVADVAPFWVTLGKVEIFDSNPDFDVVKLAVHSPELHAIHKLIGDNLKNGDTHPVFKPHETLAYVKKGEGAKYVGNSEFEGTRIFFDKLIFSDKNRNKIEIPLTGKMSEKVDNSSSSEETNAAEKPETEKPAEEKASEQNKFPTDLFGNAIDPKHQDSLFGKSEIAEMQSSAETEKQNKIREAFGKIFGDRLNDFVKKQNTAPVASRTAETIVRFRDSISEKGQPAQDFLADVQAALEAVHDAEVTGVPFEQYLHQGSFFSSVELTPAQTAIYDKIIKKDFADWFNGVIKQIEPTDKYVSSEVNTNAASSSESVESDSANSTAGVGARKIDVSADERTDNAGAIDDDGNPDEERARPGSSQSLFGDSPAFEGKSSDSGIRQKEPAIPGDLSERGVGGRSDENAGNGSADDNQAPIQSGAADVSGSEITDEDLENAFDELVTPASDVAAVKKALQDFAEDNPDAKIPRLPNQKKNSSASQTAKSKADSAVKNTRAGIEATKKALGELFNPDKFKSAGFPAFDDQTYEAAKPLFLQAYNHFKDAARDALEALKLLITDMRKDGYDDDTLRAMRPYILRFVKDLRDGKISTDQEISENTLEEEAGDDAYQNPSAAEKLRLQKDAESIPVERTDLGNIRRTLPLLFKEQQDDVHKAELRFDKADGVMFTNGTGTGKTFTGLGVGKRFQKQGKDNILIVAPNDKILEDWQNSGKLLAMNVGRLKDTLDNGTSGIVATTYANFGQNPALVKRKWDLIIFDESHYLSQNEAGDLTNSAKMLRAIALHPGGEWHYVSQAMLEDYQSSDALKAEKELIKAKGKNAEVSELRRLEEIDRELEEQNEILREKSKFFSAQFKERRKAEGKSKVVFLSATPFAYEKNIEYAEGFLFSYGPEVDSGSYNSGDARERFMMQHFGYRMRYNKLTRPDAEVNTELMEQQFNTWLKKEGALSGRRLSIEPDYSRTFVLSDNAIGAKIDEGFNWLSDRDKGDERVYRDLLEYFRKRFDYLHQRFILEAINARESIEIAKAHLALGRKIVVFHDFNKNDSFHPFSAPPGGTVTLSKYHSADLSASYQKFAAERPDLVNLDLRGLIAPSELYRGVFGNEVRFFNGTVDKKERRLAVKDFNDDAGNTRILVVQSDAGREGISLHDTTGKFQRVLINLGLPIRPIAAIQTEGRIYRVNTVTNAIQIYMTTGTSFERYAFGTKISQRSSTAENLALGEEARLLKQAFIDGYENAVVNYQPSLRDGAGGKESDRAMQSQISEFERAKTFYFGQGKKTSRNKSREGVDYFATPEPLGYKMVEWADGRLGEDAAEPSAGHGAIARFFKPEMNRTVIEPSNDLVSRLALVTDGKILQTRFEDHSIVNKYDVIVMNPPFGVGGKTAVEHLEKAIGHLRDGGRIVALLPEGPSADKRLEKLLYETPAAKDVYKIADISLPTVAFSRAGTTVKTHVIVLEKQAVKENVEKLPQEKQRDLSNAATIKEFFDQLENIEIAPRRWTRDEKYSGEVEEPASSQSSAANPLASQFLNNVVNPGNQSGTPGANSRFEKAEFQHSRDNYTVYVAKMRIKNDPDYGDYKATARRFGGWYNSFNGNGSIKGLAFKSAEAREQFLNSYAETGEEGSEMMSIFDSEKPAGAEEIFYLTSVRAIENKISGKTASKSQILNILKNEAVKQTEMQYFREWAGFDEWLADQPEKVSKQAVIDFLNENNVKLDEVVKADGNFANAREKLFKILDELKENRYFVDFESNPMTGEEDLIAGFSYGNDYFSVIDNFDGMPERFRNLALLATETVFETSEAEEVEVKYQKWSNAGGKSYHELLLTLPAKEAAPQHPKGWGEVGNAKSTGDKNNFESPHWDEKNVVVHLRFQEFTQNVDAEKRWNELYVARQNAQNNQNFNLAEEINRQMQGIESGENRPKRVFVLNEDQSDWGQKGRKDGYKLPAEKIESLQKEVQEIYKRVGEILNKNDNLGFDSRIDAVMAITNHADFADRWEIEDKADIAVLKEYRDKQQLIMKNAHAVPDMPFKKNWHELGIKRAIRWAVENGFDVFAWDTGETQTERFSLEKHINKIEYRRSGIYSDRYAVKVFDKSNKKIQDVVLKEDQLEDNYGKEIAKQIIEGAKHAPRIIDELDLKVGGEGMLGFYDDILPKFVSKYVKKWGAKVEQEKIVIGEAQGYKITQSPNGKNFEIVEKSSNKVIESFSSMKEAEGYISRMSSKTVTTHSVEITPAMRASVMEGQPLFSIADAEEEAKKRAFQVLKTVPISDLLPTAEFSRSNDRIRLNGAAQEIIRRALEQRDINRGRLFAGDDETRPSFLGLFTEPAILRDVMQILRDAESAAVKAGTARANADVLGNLANELEEAYRLGGKTAVLYVTDNKLPHEVLHQASYLGAIEKSMTKRLALPERLDEHRAFEIADREFFSKYRAYDTESFMRQHKMSRAQAEEFRKATIREEIAAWIAEESWEKLGLDKETAVDYLLKYIESYADKNGNEALEKFKESSQYVYEAVEQALRTSRPEPVRPERRAADSAEGKTRGPDEKSRAENSGSAQQSGEKESSERDFELEPDRNRRSGVTGDYSGTGKKKLASLPGTMRAAGISVDDVVYTVFGDKQAQEEARKLIEENGIEGTIKLLEQIENPDVHHAVASFTIQRTLLDEAERLVDKQPDEARRLKDIALELAARHAIKAVKAGRFTRAAAIISQSVESVVYAAQKLYQAEHGLSAKLPDEVFARVEEKARDAESAVAEDTSLAKQVEKLKREISSLKKTLAGEETLRKNSKASAAKRQKIVSQVKSKFQTDFEQAMERLKKRAILKPKSARPSESVAAMSIFDNADMSPFDERRESISKINSLLKSTRPTSEGSEKEVIKLIDNKEALRISRETGIPISTDYKHVIDKSGINHALKNHGNAKTEISRGQIAITGKDFETIPEILAAPDKIEHAGTNAKGLDVILYTKKFNGTTFYVEEVRTGRKELAFSTMYKRKSKSDPVNSPQVLTSETTPAESKTSKEDLKNQASEYNDSGMMSIFDQETANFLGVDKDLLEDLAIMGAMKLTEGFARAEHYFPSDFDADMQAEFGQSIEKILPVIHKAALRLRNEWLAEIQKEKQVSQIIKEFGDRLSDEEIEEILGERRAEFKKRGAIEKLHQLRAQKGISTDWTRLEEIISELGESDAVKVAAAMLATEQPTAGQIYEKLKELDVLKGADAREIFRQARDLKARAEKQLYKERSDLVTIIGEREREVKDIEDMRLISRRRVKQSQELVSQELRRIKTGEVKYYIGQAAEVLNTPRALMAAGDLSFMFRQGGWFAISRPREQKQAFANMLSALNERINQKGFDAAMAELENHPSFDLALKSGVDFAALGRFGDFSITKGEEEFRNNIFEKIRGLKQTVGWMIQKSDDTYTAFLDTQRLVAFASSADFFISQGLSFEENPREFKKLADYVNNATGRGTVGTVGLTNLIMQLPLFSPRFTVSRLKLMWQSTLGLAFLPPHTRKVVMRDAAGFYGANAAVLGLAAIWGLTTLDWDDDDFLKIKLPGGKRYDLFSGLQQPVRLVLRLVHSALRETLGERGSFGLIRDSFEGETKFDYLDVPSGLPFKFLRSKLSPIPSLAVDRILGEDFTGQPFSWKNAAISRMIPLLWADIGKAVYNDGALGALAVLPSVGGVGFQNYADRPEEAKTPAEKLASKINGVNFKDRVETEEDIALNGKIAELKARARRGENVAGEVNQLYVTGQISKRRAQGVINGLDDSFFESKVKRMEGKFLQEVRKVANDDEKELIDTILSFREKKAKKSGSKPVKPLQLKPKIEVYNKK